MHIFCKKWGNPYNRKLRSPIKRGWRFRESIKLVREELHIMNDEKYGIMEKRLKSVSLNNHFSKLLRDNIHCEHPEEYMINESRWMDFLIESINCGDILLPVLVFGEYDSFYKEQKEVYDRINNNKIDLNKIDLNSINILNCISRFIFLCDEMKRFGEYKKIKRDLLRYKKKYFYELKCEDIVYIKVKRNISTKINGRVVKTGSFKEEWIKSSVINIQKEKEMVQVNYKRYWFSSSDYPKNIVTTDNTSINSYSNAAWNIEHGKDALLKFLDEYR